MEANYATLGGRVEEAMATAEREQVRRAGLCETWRETWRETCREWRGALSGQRRTGGRGELRVGLDSEGHPVSGKGARRVSQGG